MKDDDGKNDSKLEGRMFVVVFILCALTILGYFI